MRPNIIASSGNVFADLGFDAEEAALLAMRAELISALRAALARQGWTEVQAAAALGIGLSAVSDLMHGPRDQFSLDLLVTLATRAGCKIALTVA